MDRRLNHKTMLIKIVSFSVILAAHQVACLPTDRPAVLHVGIKLDNQNRLNRILTPRHALNHANVHNKILRGGASGDNQSKSKGDGLINIQDLTNTELREYVGNLIVDQLWAVLPICVFLAGCQIIVLRHGISGAEGIVFGLALVVAGLALFNFGLLYGLMPTGREIGKKLPTILPLGKLLAIAGILGVAVTLAEPALGIVKTAGSLVHENKAPYLYALLHRQQVCITMHAHRAQFIRPKSADDRSLH